MKLPPRGLRILLIIASVFAVYWPSLKNEFVWDDTALVLRDPLIRSWRLIPEGFRHFLFLDATASNFYRPLQRLTYTLDYALHSFRPAGYHFTNLLLHAAAAVALFFLLEKIATVFTSADGRASPLPLLASLVWAIHPVHSSAVIYVAGRADLLAALFMFAGLALALSSPFSLAAALCLFAGMLSKESAIVSFAILFALLIVRRDWGAVKLWAVAAVVIIGAYSTLRFTAEKIEPPASEALNPAARPLLAARAFAEYAGLLVAPVNLHMERDLIAIDHGDLPETKRRARLRDFQTILGAALIFGFAWWMRGARNEKAIVFPCLIAAMIAYLPVSNLLPLNARAAEHWLYVSSAFLFAAFIATMLDRKRFAGVFFGALSLWISFLGVRTFRRNADWKDERTFFENTIASGGDSERMFINLGVLEFAQGHPDKAIADLQTALTRKADQPFALLAIAAAEMRVRDFSHARIHLEKALQEPFVRPQALEEMATLEYLEHGRERLDYLRAAAELQPKNWPVQKRFAGHLDERGDTLAAIEQLRLFLKEQSFRAETWSMLGDLLKKISRPDLARGAFEQARAYDVHDVATRKKLAELPP